MISPFDPEHLTPSASLNRMLMLPLPGANIEPDTVGKPAYAVLSLPALAQEIRARASVLQLQVETITDAQLPLVLNACFTFPDSGVRAQADAIATLWGRRLGHVVLTLKRGDETSRTARPDWDATYWNYWTRIHQIWLGGGLASGNMGPRIVRSAREVMLTRGNASCDLKLSAYPSLLPLIGAARSVPTDHTAALVFDFGGTAIKRALAAYTREQLHALHMLPPMSVPNAVHAVANGGLDKDLLHLATQIAALLADTCQAQDVTGPDLAPVLVCSIASYVVGNHPLPRQGGAYAALHGMTDNLGRWLSAEVSARLNRSMEVVLLHDGTAAAQRYAGTPNTAVITMGTALGVGFAASGGQLRPVDPQFVVHPFMESVRI